MDIRAGSAVVNFVNFYLIFFGSGAELALVHPANLLVECVTDFLLQRSLPVPVVTADALQLIVCSALDSGEIRLFFPLP